jgi:hypothetical protein
MTTLYGAAGMNPELSSRLPDVVIDFKKFTDAELNMIDEKIKELKNRDLPAAYSIEVMFSKERHIHGALPTEGHVAFWESSGRPHGDNDTLVYLCPGKRLGLNECEAFIPSRSQFNREYVCEKCNERWGIGAKKPQPVAQIFARMSLARWTDMVTHYFMVSGFNANIRVRFSPNDIRAATYFNAKAGDALDKVRNTRKTSIYTLKQIIADTSAGAAIDKRIRAFLSV